jgi:hypothetical protein
MYSVPKPVSTIRTRIRQEFERNRFVNKLSVVDVLIFRSHADYQVSHTTGTYGPRVARKRPGVLKDWGVELG